MELTLHQVRGPCGSAGARAADGTGGRRTAADRLTGSGSIAKVLGIYEYEHGSGTTDYSVSGLAAGELGNLRRDVHGRGGPGALRWLSCRRAAARTRSIPEDDRSDDPDQFARVDTDLTSPHFRSGSPRFSGIAATARARGVCRVRGRLGVCRLVP